MPPTGNARLPGTRPEGAHNEAEAAARVREMFSRIAPRYDFLNHLLSLSFDRLWRRRTARRLGHILAREDARVLDLCCGTGDLTLALARGARATVLGTDFAHPMLVLAKEKSKRALGGHGSSRAVKRNKNSGASAPEAGGMEYLESDALRLPFAGASFDLATAAFGFRNLANYEAGLREILRMLKPGGEVGILEFSEPRGRVFAPLYRFYFTRVLPRIGGLVSGSAASYQYLPSSVLKFPSAEELRVLMEQVGFSDARFEHWTGGVVAFHTARKP